MDTTYSVYYIKLGTGNELEIAERCIEKNILWLNFKEATETQIQQALSAELNNPKRLDSDYSYKEDWEPVRKAYSNKNQTVQTSNALAIRRFYTATEKDYFFTFIGNIMYYCHPQGSVIPITQDNQKENFEIGTRIRNTTGWRCTPITNKKITFHEQYLSGKLTQAKMFRGTIFKLNKQQQDIFTNTLNWDFKEYANTARLKAEMEKEVLAQIKNLLPHDFEVFVDLLLTKSGWNRVGELGGTVKAIDMTYYLPIENEMRYVQVKSTLTKSNYEKALTLLKDYFSKDTEEKLCYFIYHTSEGNIKITEKENNITVKTLNGNDLAKLCCNHQETIDWLFLKTTGKEI